MKYLSIIFLFAFLVGCKKQEVSPDSLNGTWELRSFSGGQLANPVAPSTFKAGNGRTIVFTDHEYQNFIDGKVTTNGTYTLLKESADVDGIHYNDRIIFDDSKLQTFIKISGKKLNISFGSMASDGSTGTYEKQ